MQYRFSPEQIEKIMSQALLYQCACPAQVGELLRNVRHLHRYQLDCLDETDVDVAVHRRIAELAEHVHAAVEDCLADILRLEGWDMATLKMPDNLKKRLLKEIEKG